MSNPALTGPRRGLLAVGLMALGIGMLPRSAAAATSVLPAGQKATPLTLPPLPFSATALDPVISEKTLGFHHGKHHKAYVDNLAKLVAGTPEATRTLEEIILASATDPARKGVFNNAAQAWNHNFYWASLSPEAQTPSGPLAAAIARDFGSFETLKTQLAAVCVAQFASGWGWLVHENGKLKLVSTSNADIPFLHGQTPLLTIDVWEHAYYLDAQNRRVDYVKGVVEGHLNWRFAELNFAG